MCMHQVCTSPARVCSTAAEVTSNDVHVVYYAQACPILLVNDLQVHVLPIWKQAIPQHCAIHELQANFFQTYNTGQSHIPCEQEHAPLILPCMVGNDV